VLATGQRDGNIRAQTGASRLATHLTYHFFLSLGFLCAVSPSRGDVEKDCFVLQWPFSRYSFTLLRILSVLSRALHITSPVFDIPVWRQRAPEVQSSNFTIKFFHSDWELKRV
jgi:hypothetical protein